MSQMKRCRFCKWAFKYRNWWCENAKVAWSQVNTPWQRMHVNPAESCKEYARKRWLFFAWWVPKLILTIALLVGGCSRTVLELPDGSKMTRTRFLDREKIGSVSYDAGSFTLDGYESDTSRLIGVIDRLIARKEVKP